MNTPAITSTVPATCQGPIGSPNSSRLSTMVETGPIMPTCAASVEPIRATAIITASTGSTVHSVPFTSDSAYTCHGSASASSGRSSTNCSRHSTQATLLA